MVESPEYECCQRPSLVVKIERNKSSRDTLPPVWTLKSIQLTGLLCHEIPVGVLDVLLHYRKYLKLTLIWIDRQLQLVQRYDKIEINLSWFICLQP